MNALFTPVSSGRDGDPHPHRDPPTIPTGTDQHFPGTEVTVDKEGVVRGVLATSPEIRWPDRALIGASLSRLIGNLDGPLTRHVAAWMQAAATPSRRAFGSLARTFSGAGAAAAQVPLRLFVSASLPDGSSVPAVASFRVDPDAYLAVRLVPLPALTLAVEVDSRLRVVRVEPAAAASALLGPENTTSKGKPLSAFLPSLHQRARDLPGLLASERKGGLKRASQLSRTTAEDLVCAGQPRVRVLAQACSKKGSSKHAWVLLEPAATQALPPIPIKDTGAEDGANGACSALETREEEGRRPWNPSTEGETKEEGLGKEGKDDGPHEECGGGVEEGEGEGKGEGEEESRGGTRRKRRDSEWVEGGTVEGSKESEEERLDDEPEVQKGGEVRVGCFG